MSHSERLISGEAVTAELLHYGVKGMKWGQRKSRPSSSDIKKAREIEKQIREYS